MMRSDDKSDLAAGRIALLGVPFDAFSSFLRGPAQAPAAIRRAMLSGASNLTAENGFTLGADAWRDLGDVPCQNDETDIERIAESVASLIQSGHKVLSLGGDHSVTWPIIRAHSKFYNRLTILHLDAHPDLYDRFDGSRLSNACPFARIMENRLASRLVQVGIRTLNAPQLEQAERFKVEVHPMAGWQPGIDLALSAPLYLSIDIDVLDPAFAPGVSHHEPGGLSVRDLIGLIQAIEVPLIGADIVEYNPERDIHDMTATVCVKLIKEVSAKLAE